MQFPHYFALLLVALTALAGCQKTDSVSSTPPAPEIDPVHGHLLRAQPKLPTVKVWLGDQELIAEIASQAVEIATLPRHIRGFGPVKDRALADYHARLTELTRRFGLD